MLSCDIAKSILKEHNTTELKQRSVQRLIKETHKGVKNETITINDCGVNNRCPEHIRSNCCLPASLPECLSAYLIIAQSV